MQRISLIQPDDCHLHLRDGSYLSTTVKDAASRFARAIIMPNLKPPITTVSQAIEYRKRILEKVPEKYTFEPLMTLYLTDNTSIEEIKLAKQSGIIHAFKLYPAGATTHSDAGVTHLEKRFPIFEAMQQHDIPLLLHGEVTDPSVDIFDREKVFIDNHFTKLITQFPQLRMVMEHITTREAIDFIKETPTTIAATITAHHLLLNRNHLLVSGIHPHYYCLPVVKREQDREALVNTVVSGNPKFFLGTDSAPHSRLQKENACGCAGIYTAHAAIELYTELFESMNRLDQLENFSSKHGADFYRLPYNTRQITLIKQSWTIPPLLPFGNEELVPFGANETIHWMLEQ